MTFILCVVAAFLVMDGGLTLRTLVTFVVLGVVAVIVVGLASGRNGPRSASERGSGFYRDYIVSAAWRARADAAKHRAGWRCQVCNRPGDGATLEAHHRTYERLGRELPGDITVLCEDCHETFSMARRSV